MKRILFTCFILVLPVLLMGQCFSSAGNPVGGSGNMGVLDKKTLSVMGFYRYSISDKYFEGSRPSDINVIRNANFNFLGTLIAYGLSNRVTLESELGYFINKTKNYAMPAGYSLTGSGLTNALISGKYQVYYHPEKKVEFSAAAGVKLPFTLKSQTIDNVRLPFDLQSSTSTIGAVVQTYLIKEHSYTGMRYFLYNRAEVNGTNRDGYRYGNVFINSFFVSRHLIRTSSWPVSGTLIFQLRNEIRGKSFINDEIEPSSGSVKFFICPQVNLAFVEKWNISLMVDLPVYQYYRNSQLADKIAFSVVMAKPFLL